MLSQTSPPSRNNYLNELATLLALPIRHVRLTYLSFFHVALLFLLLFFHLTSTVQARLVTHDNITILHGQSPSRHSLSHYTYKSPASTIQHPACSLVTTQDPIHTSTTTAHTNHPRRPYYQAKELPKSTKTKQLYLPTYNYATPLQGLRPSRDPIEERGGVNLYGFVGNDGINRWDELGLSDHFLTAPNLQAKQVKKKGKVYSRLTSGLGRDNFSFNPDKTDLPTRHCGRWSVKGTATFYPDAKMSAGMRSGGALMAGILYSSNNDPNITINYSALGGVDRETSVIWNALGDLCKIKLIHLAEQNLKVLNFHLSEDFNQVGNKIFYE